MSERTPPPPEIVEAIDLFLAGDVDGCRARLQAIHSQHRRRTHPAVFYAQGLCERHAGRLDDAEAALLCAIQADPQHPDYLLEYGQLLIQSGRVQRGLEVLRQAVRASDDDPELRHEFYLQNATALFAEGHAEAAVLSLQKALRFGTDPRTVRLLAEILIAQRKFDEAAAWLHRHAGDDEVLAALLEYARRQAEGA